MARTFEEKLMFDSGLPVGVSLGKLVKGQAERLALVEITKRGKVYLVAKPRDGDMYSCWDAVKGNNQKRSIFFQTWYFPYLLSLS